MTRHKGKIIIKIRELVANKFEMIIGDDGEGSKGNGENATDKGLGNKLIRIFTKQLNGNLEKLDTDGWQYKIQFESIDNLNF